MKTSFASRGKVRTSLHWVLANPRLGSTTRVFAGRGDPLSLDATGWPSPHGRRFWGALS